MLEKFRRKKKEQEENWFPEKEQKTKKPKTKRKKIVKQIEKFKPVYYEEDVETNKKTIPYLGTINRFIAAIMFFIQIISGVVSLSYSGGQLFTLSFFLTAYILAGYLWKTRSKKEWT